MVDQIRRRKVRKRRQPDLEPAWPTEEEQGRYSGMAGFQQGYQFRSMWMRRGTPPAAWRVIGWTATAVATVVALTILAAALR